MPSIDVSSQAVTVNTINADRWFSQDGNANSTPNSSMTDITIAFEDPILPAGALIKGIELVVHGQGNGLTTPGIALNNGTSTSVNRACNSTWSKTDTTRTYGSDSDEWGLSWDQEALGDVTAIVDMSTIGSSRFFFDFVGLRVHYTDSAAPIELLQGKIELLQGKIFI